MRINNNIMALNTHRQLSINNTNTQKSLEKLSSGYRINRAGDDAAGLAISEKMRAQIRGLNMASKNAQDGISLIQTAEGGLNEVHSILQRMRELAVQSANDTNVEIDRNEIQKEINQLTSEINRIGNTTEFNTMKLLNGDRAIITADETTSITKVNSGTYDAAFSLGVSWTGLDSGAEQPNLSIKFTDGNSGAFEWSKLSTTTSISADLTISRSGNDFLVDFSGKDDDGDTLTIDQDKMAYDEANDKYVYNANGISFEITADEVAKFKDGASVTIDLKAYDLDGNGTQNMTLETVETVNDYETHTLKASGTAYGSFTTPITVDSDSADFIEGVVGIKITATGLSAASGTYKVELLDKEGVALNTDTITSAASVTAINYDQHGIKFTFDVKDTDAFTITKMFDTTTITETTKKTVSDKSLYFQVGANEHQAMTLDMNDMRSVALGLSSITGGGTFIADKAVTDGTSNTSVEHALDVSSHEKAAAAATIINNAIETVSAERSKLGAIQNRLEHTINNLDASAENLTAAESRVRDVDMAKEMMEFTKQNILTQAATAMLAQANMAPQTVLKLLG